MAEVMNMPVDVVERRSSRERKDDDGNGNGNDNDNGNANANANADGEDNNKSTGNENPDASSPPPPPPPPSRRHDRDSRERSNDDRDRDVDRPPNRRSDYYEHRNRSPPVLPHRDYKRRAASPSSPPPPPYRDRRGGGPPLLPGGHLHFLRLSGLVGMTVVTMVAVEVLAEVLDLVIEGMDMITPVAMNVIWVAGLAILMTGLVVGMLDAHLVGTKVAHLTGNLLVEVTMIMQICTGECCQYIIDVIPQLSNLELCCFITCYNQ